MVELTNPQNTPEPDGATLTIESNSDLGTLYSYSKTTPFTGTYEENAAEIVANGVGQAPVIGTNTRVVTGQDTLTDHYAGWVQDSDGALYGDDLAMEFDVSSKSLTIPIADGTYNAVIDWGDGETSTVTGVDPADPTHTYAAEAADTAVVRISIPEGGAFPWLAFSNGGDRLKLNTLYNLGVVGWEQCWSAFQGCTNLSSVTIGVTDAGDAANYTDMFRGCSGIVDGFDLKSLGNISGSAGGFMRDCINLTSSPDIVGLDSAAATSLSSFMRSWAANPNADIAVYDLDVGACTNFSNFAEGSQLSTVTYDATLASWGNQTLAAGAASTTIHFGTSQYTDAASHALLLAQVTNIIDGGLAP